MNYNDMPPLTGLGRICMVRLAINMSPLNGAGEFFLGVCFYKQVTPTGFAGMTNRFYRVLLLP